MQERKYNQLLRDQRNDRIEEFWKGYLTGRTMGMVDTIGVGIWAYNKE